jgi:hypothetical protein
MSGSETKEETKPSDEFTSITMPLRSPVSSRASSEAAGGDSLGRSQVGQKLKDMNIDTKIYLNHKTKVGMSTKSTDVDSVGVGGDSVSRFLRSLNVLKLNVTFLCRCS